VPRQDRPLKICIISGYDLTQRDAEGSVRTHRLARSLAAQGHVVSLIIPRGCGSFELRAAKCELLGLMGCFHLAF